MRRTIVITLLLVVLGAAGWWAYIRFFAPDPEVLLRSQATSNAHEKILSGELAGALADIEQALEMLPGDWELLAWQSVLLEKLNRSGDESLEQAMAAGSETDVWIVRGMVALLVDEPQMALDASARLIERSPDSPQGYFLAAQSHEMMEQMNEALRLYQQAADIAASDPSHYAIYVAAKERMAALT